MEEKSKFFIIGPNSSSENPGRNKQDFTVVEQYLLAPMLLEKRLTDRSLDIIMYIVGHTSQVFSDAKSQYFLRRDRQVIWLYRSCEYLENKSGLGWDYPWCNNKLRI